MCRLLHSSAREHGATCTLAACFSLLAKKPLRPSSLCSPCRPVRQRVLRRDQGRGAPHSGQFRQTAGAAAGPERSLLRTRRGRRHRRRGLRVKEPIAGSDRRRAARLPRAPRASGQARHPHPQNGVACSNAGQALHTITCLLVGGCSNAQPALCGLGRDDAAGALLGLDGAADARGP